MDELVFLAGDQGPNYLVVEEVDALEFLSNDALLAERVLLTNELAAWDKLSDDYIVRMPPLSSYPVQVRITSVTKGTPRFVGLELNAWDKLSDEALEEFEKLVEDEPSAQNYLNDGLTVNEIFAEFEHLIDQSAAPAVWVETLYWTLDDWIDWLMGR